MKLHFILLVLLAISPRIYAQQKMILFLDEKPPIDELNAQLSERSMARRAAKEIAFDEKDAPIKTSYIDALNADGTILNRSKWLNAVSYSTHLSGTSLKSKYPFIVRVQEVGKAQPQQPDKFQVVGEKALNYGQGFAQVNQINVDCLHDLGHTGTGVYLGIIDAGFINMDQIDYFDTLYNEARVIDMHNFVSGGTVYTASTHGTSVASCIVGERGGPDEFAGSGVDVNIALYLTEDVGSETELEEFNLVAALERCDSVGVDVVNISLGYFGFDDTTTSHVYADLDGNTTIAAMGVNVAASNGIAVVMSAGNAGPSTISTPCDADNGLCVGAVDFFGDLAGFSSVGPAADGQIKPDVVARGLDAWLIDGGGVLTTANGTSFSSPIMAGATACLVGAHPTKSVAEIFDAIRMSADQFSTPDEFKGYGIPDFCVANSLLADASTEQLSAIQLNVFPNPANTVLTITTSQFEGVSSVRMYDLLGQVVRTAETNGTMKLDVSELANGIYSLVVQANGVSLFHRVVISH